MRKNIFLHFLNRDTREIFRVYDIFQRPDHAAILRQPLNAAAILCEDACYAPPGFVLEDDIAFELFEGQSAYLRTGLVKLPIRERSLADYAEKKRGEYSPARSRYSGLFDDSRLMSLSSYSDALVGRRAQIGPAIIAGFEEGVDTNAKVWKRIKENTSAEVIANLRKTPAILADQGKALTWSIISPHLIDEATPMHKEMRDALQNVYFKEYCSEFRLILLSDVPHMPELFFLPSERKVYSFRRLKVFLDTFGGSVLFLSASADFIVRMRRATGFTELFDAYVQLANLFPKDGDLAYQVRRTVEKASFKWDDLAARRSGALSDPTAIESIEIADACAELAASLSTEHGLAGRGKGSNRPHAARSTRHTGVGKLKIAIFVALEEELDVLLKQLDFRRNASGGASGSIGEIEVDVLCPREMGRVAAAVEVTRYLGQSKPKPEMVFCIGLAGGFVEANIDPGTVICCDTVVDLANRKVSDDLGGNANSKFRRRDFDCSKAVYSIAKSVDFDIDDWEKYCRNSFDWPDGRVPSLKEGKIASVDEVVASDNHRAKMVENVDKLLGVEMEAGGVCAAAHRFSVPVSVLRVVSDMADPSKADDRWRSAGMKTLAELVKRLPLGQVIELAKNS
ncbi:5'-methylthioadenosine/S-adenosylhomocysteine nucleosidase family protein [Puniceibacterium confluentis]|uniref:5'-methylthioadenosine/S-adenosylhomocysteine nucleosidase family protein n=1 Tax=Puniceibacterium confluentis TaxID=1958944 RepID=UPI0011B4076D|nr:5'-methylthioadenosine/S-adenosylhomocysteine nucleosidase [Puniceibacterium confluentis]